MKHDVPVLVDRPFNKILQPVIRPTNLKAAHNNQ